MTDMVNLYAAKTNLSKLVARRGDRHRQSGSSRRPSWFRISRRKKSVDLGRTSSESPTSPKISAGPSHPSCKSTSSRLVRLLIDTHTLLWADERPRRIAQPLHAMSDVTNEVVVSAASIWEIAIKRATGKLRFDRPDRRRRAGARL